MGWVPTRPPAPAVVRPGRFLFHCDYCGSQYETNERGDCHNCGGTGRFDPEVAEGTHIYLLPRDMTAEQYENTKEAIREHFRKRGDRP